QVRAHATPVAATVHDHAGTVRVTFDVPLEGVARGQACVLYATDGDECLGGGTIAAADRAAVSSASSIPA
ncbi:MAG: hypothetical protein LC789_18095, partial [Actinobacteria bacterium]|nr:hypothetical protein [Actinomycetota bacterium]